MVDRISAPEFIDTSRPPINDLRLWLVGLGIFGGFSLAGAGIWYATSGDATPVNKGRNDGSQQVANAAPLRGFPTDYTQIRAPAPPPPAPEKTPDKAAAPPPPAPAPAPAQVHSGGGRGKSWRQEAREADPQLIEVSRRRGSQGGEAMAAAPGAPGGSSGTGGAPGGSRGGIYSTAKLTGPMPGQVNARTPIRAHTEQPISTDAPGYVTALTVGDIYTADKSCVAIPHGSRLYGETMTDVKEGQWKVTTIWTNLHRPLPRNDDIELTKVVGADRDGTPGISGSVNNHWLRKFGFIVASSAIDLGTAYLGGKNGNGGTLVIGGTIAGNARSPLDEFAKKQLDVPPTIEVEPKEISVMLSQHLALDCFDER